MKTLYMTFFTLLLTVSHGHTLIVSVTAHNFTDGFTYNLNDTSYTRILDGILLSSSFIIKDSLELAELQYISDPSEVKKIGIKSVKPVMIIKTAQSRVEFEIDSVLLSNPKFVEVYSKYPSSIKFPISINGELLTYEKKKATMNTLKLNNIRTVIFLNNIEAAEKYSNAPFGVIEVQI